jgi:mannose-6-phosphate isomerase class I
LTYDRFPFVAVTNNDSDCSQTWDEIALVLKEAPGITVVELYPGCDGKDIASHLAQIIAPDTLIDSTEALLSAKELDEKFKTALSDDPVFAYMSSSAQIEDFFSPEKLAALRNKAATAKGRTLVIGTGASLIAPDADRLIYADLARWEIQRRQRAHQIGNLGVDNAAASPAALYKRAFFLDWRAADRLKTALFDRIDFLLDTNLQNEPKLIAGEQFRAALHLAASRPFRVVPFFDPGPWGGQWMKEKFQLPDGPPNYAWCFDCVPEENSLLLGFGSRRVEIPAIDLVLYCPQELLGEHIVKTFGAEFPIRFDYLDTMAGGNLSLQVHPLRQYIRDKFGMDYTQDESYYMLDAGDDGVVYLGLKDGIDPQQMESDLRRAQKDANAPFPAEQYVNVWPARKHDHFLIPAGTIHCSGRDGLVLEISATPYIFTFKLWDWGRLGLDGKPRPIHLDHGLKNIQWNRTTEWVKENLINHVSAIASADCWREESTGLHELEFIETRRHWFTGAVPHDTAGTVNVLNLVEGDEAIVESPTDAFPPFTIRYGETFIVPAQVGPYTVRPARETSHPLATMKAFVRENA